MGDGGGDLQSPWHIFFGKYFSHSTILDVGAGIGKSKQRLEANNNIVTTQDINPTRVGLVDIIDPIETIDTKFDYVVSFDVIEHVSRLKLFLEEKRRLSLQGILDTTPNWYKYPRVYHFTSVHLDILYHNIFGKCDYSYFFRIKGSESDTIESVSRDVFLNDKEAYAYGILVE